MASILFMENIYIKAAKSISKIFVLAILIYLTLLIFYAKDNIQLGVDFFILIFITIPTIFIVFLNGKASAKFPILGKIWKIYRFFYALFIILYIAMNVMGEIRANDKEKTQKTIDFINSKKITLDDVMGKNLPPKPDQKLNDSTIGGIDANNNYIRDDVELAIFEKYPNDPKIRSAMLQYAQALQLELTQVYSEKTFVPVLQKDNVAFFCLGRSDIDKSLAAAEKKQEYVKLLVFNTDAREDKNEEVYEKFMTSYMSLSDKKCDIEIQ